MQRGLLLRFVACCVRVLLFCSFVLGWMRWRGGVFDVFRRVDVWRVLRVGPRNLIYVTVCRPFVGAAGLRVAGTHFLTTTARPPG